MNKYKCPICEKSDIAENMVKIGSRHYHKGECEKAKKEGLNEKDVDKQSWGRLFYYICDLYEVNKPNGFMLKQISNFKKDYEYTNDGIYETLKYYHETLGNEVKQEFGLGIVPHYYEQAKKHCADIWSVEDYMDEFVEDEKERVINVKQFNKPYINNKHKEIEFSSVTWEEDDE